MKKNYSVNTTNSRNHFGIPSRLSSLLPLLLVAFGLFGVNEEACGWNVSGQAVSNNGTTYYVYDNSTSKTITAGGLITTYGDEITLNGPGATVQFDACRSSRSTGNLTLQKYNGSSWVSDIWHSELTTSYTTYYASIDVATTKIQFYIPSGKWYKYYKNLKVVMAQYVDNPSVSSLNCGTADINKSATDNTFTIAWCNVPALTYSIGGTDKDLFSVSSISNNSEAGKWNTATFKVACDHTKRAGSHSATLTINYTIGGANYSKTVNLSGTTNKLQPEVTWSPDEAIFNVDDVLTATNSNGLTVTLSGNSTYVGCQNNTATMLAATSGKITVTAHVTGNSIYADRDITKEITITNLEKQYISWNQDFSHLKTTDGSKSITLNATSDSGLPVIYELVGDQTGLSLTQSGSVWTLTYSATECKNTTIVAKQGGNETYAPASSVSKVVKVIDPMRVCDTNETLVNSTITLKDQSTTYNIDIPSTMTIKVSRTKTGFFDVYLYGFKVEIYSGRNGTGTKLHEYSYEAGDINNSKTISLSNLNIVAKSVKLISEATNGYNVTSVTYTKQKKCTISPASLTFETYPNTTTSAKTFDVNYANYPISLECSNPKFAFSPAEFGDCDAYGTQTISVTYTAGNAGGADVGYLYVKDNTGATLQICTLNVTINKVTQSITSTTIQNTYNTTDRVELSAEANSGLTNFVYSATPEGVASFEGNVMTFLKSGTIAITATQPGDAVYASTSTTVNGVQVNKVTPTITTYPTVETIQYLDQFANNQLIGGKATVTLRGVKDTQVSGTFAWKNAGNTVTDAPGSHDYEITFTPTDGGMYNSNTFTQSVTISRANGGIEMNDGEVKVKVAGINDDLNEYKIDLDNLIDSKTTDAIDANRAGAVTYEVISDNKANAAIDANNVFSATAVGTYTIRATQAQTDYYEQATDEFTVTVNKLVPTIVFDNTDDPQIIYSGDSIGEPAVRMYNGKIIDRKVQYVSNDIAIYVGSTADSNKYPYLKARSVDATEGNAVAVTITATTVEDALYTAASQSVTHNYAVRAKRSTYFYLDGDVDNVAKTLAIGGTATITYDENVDANFTVGTETEKSYITYTHNTETRTITVTAVKGMQSGNGEQTIRLQQPGTPRYWGKTKDFTFTVTRNASTLSLAGLAANMSVEDTITTPYTGLANTAEAVQFTCSPEGSMKMENGKLIALQAGTNTVTFSQPATEYWTGVSESKTITVSKKNPNMTTELSDRHAWYSIIEHPFKSLNTEKSFTITSSNDNLAKYVATEDKIYVYGTSGSVTFTVNQDANYKYNAVVNYQKTFTIFQPNNRLPMTLTSNNLSDYNGGSAGSVSWNDNGVVVGKTSMWDGPGGWEAKYITLKFVGVPDKLSFDFENTSPIATQYGWHFYQSSNGKDWSLIKEYQDALANASGGTSSGSESNLQLDPATQYVKLEYHGNYGGRFKNVNITERKEIVPQSASTDFGLGYNGNDPTARTIKVDWYNVQPCTVTIINDAEGRFELAEGSNVINSLLDNYGTAELVVRYKHDVNTATQHTATLHIQSQDGKTADVALSGQTTPAPQTIIWRSDLTPMPSEGSFSSAAYSTSGLDITLTSLNPEFVTVGGDDNLTLTPVAPGTAYVCAYQAGNEKWAQVAETLQIVVTSLKVQQITWDDQLSNRKHEEGKSETITLSASSSANLPITYTLDEAAQQFATITGNTLTLTGWGKGTVTAHQIGNEEYVAVEKSKTLVSRNPSAGCNPLVGEYASEYTLHTLAEKEIELDGEPGSITFWAKCDATALYGLWVAEYYGGYWHDVKQINRLDEHGITSTDTKFGPYNLNINSTKVKLYTKTGATMTRTFHNVEVTLAKYLSLQDNPMDFSQVDKGSIKTQSFYIDYSNLTGVLDVEMQNKTNTQFTVLTPTVGEDCGDAAKSARIDIQFTGSTLGTENNTIIVSNKDQRLEIPVSATVVLPTQAITWNPELDIFTTDQVQLEATATSGFEVTFTSNNSDIAEPYRRDDGTWWLNIHSYGSAEIVAHQPGDNESWGAAKNVQKTFQISRVTPTITDWPTAGGVVLPNTASASTLMGGTVQDNIAGTFRWKDGSAEVKRGANTFTVIFEPENDAYYNTVSRTMEIPILKTPQTITWEREDETTELTSNLIVLNATASSGLAVSYQSSDQTLAVIETKVLDNQTATVLRVLKSGTVTITATQDGDETYAAAEPVLKLITLNRAAPTITTNPNPQPMYIHHFLSDATLVGGQASVDGVGVISGSFAWHNTQELMDTPGENSRVVVFTPYNQDLYTTQTCTLTVDVQRFAPQIEANVTTDPVVYGTPLSGITMHGTVTAIDQYDPAHPVIQGTWTWKLDPQCVLGVADQSTRMVFHPTRQDWYDDVEFDVPLTITNNNDFTPTATATIIYGQTLREAVFVSTTQNPLDPSLILDGNIRLGNTMDQNACYDEGEHTVTIAMQVTSDDNFSHDWKEGTATLIVQPGLIFNGSDGVWGEATNWLGGVPGAEDRVTIDANVDVVSDVAVSALTINAGKTVTIKNGATLTVGANNSFNRETYGNIHVEEGGKLFLTSGRVGVNNLYLDASLGNNSIPANSGQIRNVEQIDVNGDAYFDLRLDPVKCSYGWYDFTVPFPVDNRTGISRFQNGAWNTALKTEQHYAIMTYYEDIRANGQYGWKKYYGIMQPGKCYTITVDNTAPLYRFRKVNGADFNTSNTVALTATDGTGGVVNKGWNCIGNGTLTHTLISSAENYKVQIYDHANNSYGVLDDHANYEFPVGTAVFVQTNVSTNLVFTDVNTIVAEAPMRTQGRTLEEYLLTFGRENDAINQDRLYLSASEDAENVYEIGHDLAKFGTSTTVAQIWADAYGQKLCDVEAPLVDDQAIIPISLYAAQTGTYTLETVRGPQDASLYLMYNGAVIWNLSQSAYTFDLTRGTTTGYSLLLTAEAPSITTGVDAMQHDNNQAEKIILNGQLYILRDGQMYDATGKKVK